MALHLDDAELDTLLRTATAVAYCPWAYLRLGQGVTRAGRHAEFHQRGGRLALGCDAENAGDAVDVLRAAALAVGLARDAGASLDHWSAHTALELATIGGAEAIGMDAELGSLEVGKRADVVLVDTTGPGWTPPSADPVLGLIWGGGGRRSPTSSPAVRSSSAMAAVSASTSTELREQAMAASERLLHDAGLDPQPRWPLR